VQRGAETIRASTAIFVVCMKRVSFDVLRTLNLPDDAPYIKPERF
jgi:hypothetical protein